MNVDGFVFIKWIDSHMPLLIQLYQQQECLWNPNHVDYSNTHAREKAYAGMVESLNMPELTVFDLKNKIKSVRSRYILELNKITNSEKSGTGTEEVYEPRLFWFKDADVFLRSVSTPNESSSNLKDCNSTRRHISDLSGVDLTDSEETSDNEAISPEDSIISPVASTTKKYSPLNKNFRKRSLETSFFKETKKLKQMVDDYYPEPNEFDVFCESLAIQLKKMPLHRAVICQGKLQSVMTQERLFQLKQPISSISSTSSAFQQPTEIHVSDSFTTPPSADFVLE